MFIAGLRPIPLSLCMSVMPTLRPHDFISCDHSGKAVSFLTAQKVPGLEWFGVSTRFPYWSHAKEAGELTTKISY